MAKLKPNQFILSGHLITELPILFQTEMVQAILEDRKTQTRRINKLDKVNIIPDSYMFKEPFPWQYRGNPLRFNPYTFVWIKKNDLGVDSAGIYIQSTFGHPGDLLWARETWADLNGDFQKSEPELIFKADFNPDQHGPVTWKPSIHLFKADARIWLMIEEISIERLVDISEEDSIAEGILKINLHGGEFWKRYDGYQLLTSSPIVSFWSLWASINGEESWHQNPWIWVIKYRVLSKTGRPSESVILENYLQVTGKEVANV